MSTSWLGFLLVGGLCGLKFIPGAAICIVCGIGFEKQLILTFVGGSIGVIFFTFFGIVVGKIWRRIFPRKKPKEFQKPSLAERLWDKYGLLGTALLTPPILSPPVGTAIALTFGTPKLKIIIYHILSMLLWALIFAFLGHSILHFLQTIGIMSSTPDCGIFGNS